jgi:branched-chain amino acid transport system substrate-binding protein
VRSKKLLVVTLVLLVLGVLSLALLTACGGGETTTTTAAPPSSETTAPPSSETTVPGSTETTGAAEMGEDLVIGVLNSMTGVNALTGQEQKWAQEKAAADQNAKGGIKLADGKMHKVVLKFYDDKSSDQEAAAAMEKAIKTDGLKIFLSSNTTPYNQAAATVAEQYQVYFHINTSWIDFIGGMGLKWSTDVFESAAESGLAAVGAAKNLTEPITKFAVMTENNPDGVGFGDATKAGLEAQGWQVPAYEKFVEGQKDFSSIILKYKNAGVEGIVTLISPADGITFVRQLKEQGWAPKFMFGYKGFWPVEFMKALGPDSDYICFDGFWTETYPYPYAKELGQAFRDEHNGASSVSVGLPYAAAQILFTAIERAGVFEPGPVRDQVFGGSFPGTTMGDIQYDDKGIAHIPFLGFQWMGGERVVVHPTQFATGKTQVFKPWDQR